MMRILVILLITFFSGISIASDAEVLKV